MPPSYNEALPPRSGPLVRKPPPASNQQHTALKKRVGEKFRCALEGHHAASPGIDSKHNVPRNDHANVNYGDRFKAVTHLPTVTKSTALRLYPITIVDRNHSRIFHFAISVH